MLASSDLSAAADPALKLTDELERDLIARTSEALTRRATILADRLNTNLAALRPLQVPL